METGKASMIAMAIANGINMAAMVAAMALAIVTEFDSFDNCNDNL